MRLLAGSSPLWTQIEKTLSEHGEIGSEIPLRCDQHHQAFVKVCPLEHSFIFATHIASFKSLQVRKPEDFPSGPFCQEVCGALLDCGHGCVKTCHKNAFHTLQCAAVVRSRWKLSVSNPLHECSVTGETRSTMWTHNRGAVLQKCQGGGLLRPSLRSGLVRSPSPSSLLSTAAPGFHSLHAADSQSAPLRALADPSMLPGSGSVCLQGDESFLREFNKTWSLNFKKS